MNENKRTLDLVHSALSFFREHYDLEAVGIRLKKGNKYPYFGTQGFPKNSCRTKIIYVLRPRLKILYVIATTIRLRNEYTVKLFAEGSILPSFFLKASDVSGLIAPPNRLSQELFLKVKNMSAPIVSAGGMNHLL